MMNHRSLLTYFCLFAALTLLAPPVLQLMQVDLGSWSYVDTSEEEQTTPNPVEVQEKLISFSKFQLVHFSENEGANKVRKNHPLSVSRFSAKIILPPPEFFL